MSKLGINSTRPIVFRELRWHLPKLPRVEEQLHELQCKFVLLQELACAARSPIGERSLLPATRDKLNEGSALSERAMNLSTTVRRQLAQWASGLAGSTLLQEDTCIDLEEFRKDKADKLARGNLWAATERLCIEADATLLIVTTSLDYLSKLYRVDARLFTHRAHKHGDSESSWLKVIQDRTHSRRTLVDDLNRLLREELTAYVSDLRRSLRPALPLLDGCVNDLDHKVARLHAVLEERISTMTEPQLTADACERFQKFLEISPLAHELISDIATESSSSGLLSNEEASPLAPVNETATVGADSHETSSDTALVAHAAEDVLTALPRVVGHLECTLLRCQELLDAHTSSPQIVARVAPVVHQHMDGIGELISFLTGPFSKRLSDLQTSVQAPGPHRPRSSAGSTL